MRKVNIFSLVSADLRNLLFSLSLFINTGDGITPSIRMLKNTSASNFNWFYYDAIQWPYVYAIYCFMGDIDTGFIRLFINEESGR